MGAASLLGCSSSPGRGGFTWFNHQIRYFPDQADIPQHMTLWDASNYKTASHARQLPCDSLYCPTPIAYPPSYQAQNLKIACHGPGHSLGEVHLHWMIP